MFNPPLSLFLKKLFYRKKKRFSFILYTGDRKNWLGFGVKHIIDSLSFLFLLTHIGLNLNFSKYLNES